MGEEIFTKLRFGFQGGYTIPQYCIDYGIKKPLFVLEKSAELFLKEIHAQFFYDNRLSAQFCFLDTDKEITTVWLDGFLLNQYIYVKKFSEVNIKAFDKIIFLTNKQPKISSEKIIYFNDFEKTFLRREYFEIPLLHFLQRYPAVKLIHVNFSYGPEHYDCKDGKEFFTKLLNNSTLKKTSLRIKTDMLKHHLINLAIPIQKLSNF